MTKKRPLGEDKIMELAIEHETLSLKDYFIFYPEQVIDFANDIQDRILEAAWEDNS